MVSEVEKLSKHTHNKTSTEQHFVAESLLRCWESQRVRDTNVERYFGNFLFYLFFLMNEEGKVITTVGLLGMGIELCDQEPVEYYNGTWF